MIYTKSFLERVANSGFVNQIRNGVLTIDNSEYSSWDACFAKGVYNGALKRVGARSRAPLAFGGAVHVGIEHFLKGLDNWRDAALADAAITELDSLGDPKRNTRTLINLLEAYALEYTRSRDLKFKILSVEGQPAIEKSFVVPLGKITVNFESKLHVVEILWAGKIDILSDFNGAICPVDHKTTSMLGEKFIDDKQRSTQMLGYTYAAKYLSKALFNDMPVFGVRINALAQRSSGFEFRIFDIPYADWKIAEWQQETLYAIEKLVIQLDNFLRTAQISPTRETCVTKYGKCPYFDVCDSHPTMRDRMIFDDSYFFVSDWSPLND